MAKNLSKRNAATSGEDEQLEVGLPALERIANLLAVIATRDLAPDAAAVKLDALGFTGREIAAILGVSSTYAGVAKFRAKGSRKTPKKRS